MTCDIISFPLWFNLFAIFVAFSMCCFVSHLSRCLFGFLSWFIFTKYSFLAGPSSREAVKSPPRAKSSGHQVRSPFYPRANIHPSGISVSSVASIAPPSSAFDKEKTDLHVTSAFGKDYF